MANRHLSRSVVLQSMFEWDFAHKDDAAVLEIVKRNADEFAPGTGDFLYIEKLAQGILSKQKELDDIIEKAAPDWPIDKISVVDRNILRLGLFELLFADRKEVPAKVAINEAIELAKSFGGESSSRFVNGVLGAVYKEIGEPGKDEVSKRKQEIPYEQLPVERKAGAVVFARDGENVYLALVHDVFGHWTLAKGGVQEGESIEDGVKREIKDEIGLNVEIREKLGENEYVANQPEKGKIRKHVTYFLAEGPFDDLTLEKKGGLDDAKWFKLADIIDLNFYDDILHIVTKAVNILLQKQDDGTQSTKGNSKQSG